MQVNIAYVSTMDFAKHNIEQKKMINLLVRQA